jgi:hypothetical protein
MVFDVPAGTARLEYGVGVAGPGKLWIDEPKVQVVGSDVPVTNHRAASSSNAFPGEVTVADWLMTGVGAPDYAFVADGDAVRIEPKEASPSRFVAVVHVLPADAYVGKHVTVSFDLRTDGVAEGACIAKAQDGRVLQYAGFLGGNFKEVKGPQPAFTPCEVGFDVPPDTKWILYGYSYKGMGKAWLRGGKLEAR